ncbi:MAG: ComEC/Rec2 family competence protein, partial [Oscillospiraceae bacterium]|nr:ComEC/Rec2 family competence protein [Oscillospiraceae bacterium]
VSAIALTFTMPFTLYYFGTFTFVSVFTTLLFTPILVCSLYLAVFVMLFGSLSLPGEVFCFLSETLYTFTSRLCSLLSDCMYTVLSAEYPFARILTILFVISLLALLLFSVQRPWAYLIPVLTFTVCLYTSVAIYNACNAHSVSSVMRETNRNDFLAFRIGGETTVLDIGACTASSRRAGLHAARTEIYSTMVDNYMLLNHNNRTPAYLSTLLDDTRIYNLYIPEEFSNTESYKSICQTAKENGTKVHTFTFGERTEMGSIAILTMTPKYIQRSRVPIHGIEIQGAGSTFFYAGAAFIESGGKLPKTQSIIFGSYGPLYKEKFSVKTEQNIFTSPTAQLFFEGAATVYTDAKKDILNNS